MAGTDETCSDCFSGSGTACFIRSPRQDQSPAPNIRPSASNRQTGALACIKSGAAHERASRSAAPRPPISVESALGGIVLGDLCRQISALRLASGTLELSTSTFSCAREHHDAPCRVCMLCDILQVGRARLHSVQTVFVFRSTIFLHISLHPLSDLLCTSRVAFDSHRQPFTLPDKIMTAANGITNGVSHPVQQKSTDYGHEAVDKILDKTVQNDSQSRHPLVLQTFRLLIADLCQQFGGGHPG